MKCFVNQITVKKRVEYRIPTRTICISIFSWWLTFTNTPSFAVNLDKQGTQWAPFLEWSLENTSFSGNPFDVEAQAVFSHRETGEVRTTPMFFAGQDIWKFRFTGDLPGIWEVITVSEDPDLDEHSGIVTIRENPDPQAIGFLVNFGSFWGWQGTERVFTPQLIMYKNPEEFFENPEEIDWAIRTFIDEHGFSGFHVPDIAGWWFDIEQSYNNVDPESVNPDLRTFEALELLITRAHEANAMVHLWMWGDQERKQTPLQLRGGPNGAEDRRLQRYIAARLGPLPGWSMGYGFDLWEWTTEESLNDWYRFMRETMGWPHLLGARSSKNKLTQLSSLMDYASYEWHRPGYDDYVDHLTAIPGKPAFSEDRFRLCSAHAYKDYDPDMTRRGLWHSTMAGGVANIWGNFQPGWWKSWLGCEDQLYGSLPYPNAEVLRTYSVFFDHKRRFQKNLMRVETTSAETPGNQSPIRMLKTPDGSLLLIYQEDTDTVQFDLSNAPGPLPVVAVDTRQPYREIDLGLHEPGRHAFDAPHLSDWALAIGDFDE